MIACDGCAAVGYDKAKTTLLQAAAAFARSQQQDELDSDWLNQAVTTWMSSTTRIELLQAAKAQNCVVFAPFDFLIASKVDLRLCGHYTKNRLPFT